MTIIPQKLCKIMVSLAFVAILAGFILRYNSGTALVIVESVCQTPFSQGSICAHCLKYPQSIHSRSLYRPASLQKHRLGIRTCKNYSCSEMLQLYNDQSQKMRYKIMYIVSEFLQEIGASRYYQNTDKEALRSAKSWVVFTSNDTYPVAPSQTIHYFSEDIGSVTLLACGLSLSIIAYVSVFIKNFNISFLKLTCECLVMIGLVIQYTLQAPSKYSLILIATRMAFVFLVLLCTKSGVLVATLGACLSYIGWYLNQESHNPFLSLLCIILINCLSVCSLWSRPRDSVGFSQKLSTCLLLIYSILVIGETIDTNYAPFGLLIIIFMNWTMSIIEVYSIDNVNFQLYEKRGQKIEEEQTDQIELDAGDLDTRIEAAMRR